MGDGAPGQEIDEIRFDPFESPYRPHREEEAVPAADTPTAERDPVGPLDFRAAVADYETRILESALAANRFNQRATAAHLSLSYDQLRNSLKKHGLIGR